MNIKKTKEEKFNPVLTHMTMGMIGDLDRIALNNGVSRNEVIRQACRVFIKKGKFKKGY